MSLKIYLFFKTLKKDLKEESIRRNIKNKNGTITETIILKLTQNIGLWLGENRDEMNWISKIGMFCFFLIVISAFIELIIAKNDPQRFFDCFNILNFCIISCLKFYSLQFKKNYWKLLLNKAYILENDLLSTQDNSDVDYESDEEENDCFPRHILLYSHKILSSSTLIFKLYSFTVSLYILSPFIEFGICTLYGGDASLFHIVPIWSPLDNYGVLGNAVSIIFETIGSIYCVANHLVFDIFSTSIMIFIRGQFSLLHEYSQEIGGKGKDCNLSRARDDRANYRIKKCHFLHLTLIRMVKNLDELIRNIIGIYFLLASLILCCVCIQLQSKELSATQLISLLQYMCSTLIQLFLFCYYGDAVQNESVVSLGRGPYASAWWCLGYEIRRDLAFLCSRMSVSCKLLAGPFSILNLESFIQIVRTAYSYYAVLRQTSEESRYSGGALKMDH